MLPFIKKSIRTRIFISILLPLAFVEILLLYLHISNINNEFVKIYKSDASTISAPFIKSIVGKLEALDKVADQKGFLEVYIDLKGEIEFPKWVNEYKNVLKIAFVNDSEKLLSETSGRNAISDLELNALHTRSSNIRKDGYISILVPLYVKEVFMGNLIFWFSDSELKLKE
ncbi:MAG: hypothetical protein GY857_06000, partial [Desulfobacula sp.]|nr:hypothetical protein [Desulfobacula sp.]